MIEPTAHDRCHGQTTHQVCPLRESCGRYTRKPMAHAWYLQKPGIPGPCEFYQPKKEAPHAG